MKNKAKILFQQGWKSLGNIRNDFKVLLDFDISHDHGQKSFKKWGLIVLDK